MKVSPGKRKVSEFTAGSAVSSGFYTRMTEAILNSSPLAICVFDSNSKMIDCNVAALELFDVSDKKSFLDNHMFYSVPIQPDGIFSGEAARGVFNQVKETGVVTMQWIHRTADGETVPTENTTKKLFFDNNEFYIMYIRDLRPEISSREAIREITERNDTIINETPICCIYFDSSFKIITCNPAALTLFGVSDIDSFIDAFFTLNPKHQRDGTPSYKGYINKLQDTINRGKLVFEWEHKTSHGVLLPVDTTLVRVDYKGGYRIIGYIRDLREQKAVLRETKRAEKKLKEAKELAEENSRIKSEFLANMSHELRTPMSGIIGLTNLALRHETSPEQRSYLENIYHSANSLLRILNDILDFSKIEAGKLTIEYIPVNIHNVLLGVYNTKSLSAEQKGLDFIVNTPAEIDFNIISDSLRLTQVLLNLADNAIKFTENGTVSIDVKIFERDGNKITLLFSVSDTGIGMTKAEMSRLFSAFRQADASISRKYGGSGLGLAISKSIITMMGGKIWLDSTPRKGTTFYFTIGAAITQEAVPDDGDGDKSGSFSVPESLRGSRILLVEDNEINRIIANEILSSAGFDVAEAENGLAAVEMTKAYQFDAIIMDIQMPEMDGFTATKIIRGNKGYRKTPIIAMTANAMHGDMEKSLSVGMNDHVTKPVSPDALLETLCKHLLLFGKF